MVMSDTCPAISRHMPKGVRTVATDSAKQAHYLPAITGVQAWFGSVRDCVDAAISGTWRGSTRWMTSPSARSSCAAAASLAAVPRAKRWSRAKTISGWGGINERDGTTIERRHELRGISFKGRVLVFPGAKGSSGWSAYFHMARLNGVAPAARIFTRDDYQSGARRSGHASADDDRIGSGPAGRDRDRRLGQGGCGPRRRRSDRKR